MIIAFEKNCECGSIEASYPKPSISTRAPKVEDPFAYIEISFYCPICSTPWLEIIANNFGECAGPKIGSKLIISSDASVDHEAFPRRRLLKPHA